MASSAGIKLSECTHEVRPVSYDGKVVTLIDQKVLPGELKLVRASTPAEVWAFIRDMTVRGAPAIGAAGGFAMAMAAAASGATSVAALMQDVAAAKAYLDSARPTAVNLMWATGRLHDIAAAYAALPGATVASLVAALADESQALAELDVEMNRALARHGATVVPQGANILHHW
jgi:methylthioribose-1-phosphate isomerase